MNQSPWPLPQARTRDPWACGAQAHSGSRRNARNWSPLSRRTSPRLRSRSLRCTSPRAGGRPDDISRPVRARRRAPCGRVHKQVAELDDSVRSHGEGCETDDGAVIVEDDPRPPAPAACRYSSRSGSASRPVRSRSLDSADRAYSSRSAGRSFSEASRINSTPGALPFRHVARVGRAGRTDLHPCRER